MLVNTKDRIALLRRRATPGVAPLWGELPDEVMASLSQTPPALAELYRVKALAGKAQFEEASELLSKYPVGEALLDGIAEELKGELETARDAHSNRERDQKLSSWLHKVRKWREVK